MTQNKVAKVLVHHHKQPILRRCKFKYSGVVSGLNDVLHEGNVVACRTEELSQPGFYAFVQEKTHAAPPQPETTSSSAR